MAKARACSFPWPPRQDLLGAQNKASIFFVKCTDPAYTEQTAEAIRTLLPNYSIMPIKDVHGADDVE